jgi:hypothetical protein
MKGKVIHAELRKQSKTFKGWLKYEVTIQYNNGSQEKVPAYGRDLQDALSRVVHDARVESITKKARIVPWWGWVSTWFGYLGFISAWWYRSQNTEILAGGILSGMFILLILMLWSKNRNVEK